MDTYNGDIRATSCMHWTDRVWVPPPQDLPHSLIIVRIIYSGDYCGDYLMWWLSLWLFSVMIIVVMTVMIIMIMIIMIIIILSSFSTQFAKFISVEKYWFIIITMINMKKVHIISMFEHQQYLFPTGIICIPEVGNVPARRARILIARPHLTIGQIFKYRTNI